VLRERIKEVPVFDKEGAPVGELTLPEFFGAPVRKDLILRAFLSEFTSSLQPKGRDPMAGKRTTAESLGVGYGLARVPRIKGTLRAALVNFARGGRLAHPPRVEEKIAEKMNRKEKLLATISAVAATAEPNLVKERGHLFSAPSLPIVIDDSVESSISKSKEARELLSKIGVYEDVERAKKRCRVRAGRGKMRGRRYVEPKSVLFVLASHNSPLALSVRGFPGVDVATPDVLSVLHLAPGGVPGRLTVYSLSALEVLRERFSKKASFVVVSGGGVVPAA